MTSLKVHPLVEVLEYREDGYDGRYGKLRFIVSHSIEEDNKNWLHASVSVDGGNLPTYEDLKTLKRLCIGDDEVALQVFPADSDFYDISTITGIEVLHLWSCLDEPVTPNFLAGGSL